MTMICYREINFRPATRELIDIANEIIEEYEDQGLNLTLRQLYYQFVARGYLANTERNYKRLGDIVSDARMAGLISWTAIEDRTRFVRELPSWDNPAHIIRDAALGYRTDKWASQLRRVEVWIEKDALIGVIEGVCQELQVPCFSCRGYVSASELWRASRRVRKSDDAGQETVILHLGDHDPSGVDMTRDIQDRLVGFGVAAPVVRIALTMEQIKALKPPPNPAKQTDARFADYAAKFGEDSWELDALDPVYLVRLVRRSVEALRDEALWNKAVRREERQRKVLKKISQDLAKK